MPTTRRSGVEDNDDGVIVWERFDGLDFRVQAARSPRRARSAPGGEHLHWLRIPEMQLDGSFPAKLQRRPGETWVSPHVRGVPPDAVLAG